MAHAPAQFGRDDGLPLFLELTDRTMRGSCGAFFGIDDAKLRTDPVSALPGSPCGPIGKRAADEGWDGDHAGTSAAFAASFA
jgi:hypothetical protein